MSIEETNDYILVNNDVAEDTSIIPRACPNCFLLFRTLEDELSYSEFGCCDKCSQHFARPNRTEWELGWRPDKSKINEMIDKINLYFNIEV